MKIFSNTCEFDYPWDEVTAANWRKYPNEVSTHVIAVDVLRRELNQESMVLTTERLITCKQSVPRWILSLVGGKDVSYVREVSTVDLKNKTLKLRSINLTMSNLLKVFETVTYKPNSLDSQKTTFTQEAQITAYASFQRICNKIEDWSVDRFGENSKKGKLGFDSVLTVFNEQWKKTDGLVDVLVNQVDTSIDTLKDGLVKETENLLNEADKVKDVIVKETDKILEEAVQVQKSILVQYYDTIRAAFK